VIVSIITNYFTSLIEHVFREVIYTLVFFLGISLVNHFFAIKLKSNKDINSIMLVQAITGIRLFSSMVFILILLLTTEEQQFSLAIAFFLSYLFFTGFEIYHLITNLRLDLNSQEE